MFCPKVLIPFGNMLLLRSHCWVKRICQFHQHLIEQSRKCLCHLMSLSLGKCNYLTAQLREIYPVCLVLAANSLFMSTLVGIPYESGTTIFFRGDVWQHFTILATYSFIASAGNRTRATRVAGEHSTTEPPMLTIYFFTPFDLEIEGIYCFTNRACSGVVGDVSVKTILHSARLGLSYIAGISNYDLPFD